MVNATDKITLYWVEEQEIFQKLYLAVFSADSPVEVIGNSPYGDFKTLRENLHKYHPDVLLFGCNYISSPLIHELEQFQADFPSMGIMLLPSVLRYDDLVGIRHYVESIKSPFGFFFKKSITRTEQLFSMVSLLKMGQVVIDPTLSHLISAGKDRTTVARGLTAREIEILHLVSRGFTNVAISNELCIDVKTVRHHINNIYSKLQTSDNFDNRHPRVSATNAFLKLTGQLTFDDNSRE